MPGPLTQSLLMNENKRMVSTERWRNLPASVLPLQIAPVKRPIEIDTVTHVDLAQYHGTDAVEDYNNNSWAVACVLLLTALTPSVSPLRLQRSSIKLWRSLKMPKSATAKGVISRVYLYWEMTNIYLTSSQWPVTHEISLSDVQSDLVQTNQYRNRIKQITGLYDEVLEDDPPRRLLVDTICRDADEPLW
ncbi:hypothetical protein BU25DRAFT_474037 [Macroventuria anomochaeta]|uniref:Uncharacterized protein n=1 Tax=Macroventuria anomochaeta TaxID=301207 RepID=A0ACB6RW90_9PLEO|nr:uncharacterized protein BU25DRAFT_474037 [Macroventuria anomochaeta]KAF2625403.1 hypothetical protein BU25DRAFT_474037 [Macroventuria anomochaeta]